MGFVAGTQHYRCYQYREFKITVEKMLACQSSLNCVLDFFLGSLQLLMLVIVIYNIF
jgi:hypothetical protein